METPLSSTPSFPCCFPKSKLICLSAGLAALILVAIASFLFGRASVKLPLTPQTSTTPTATALTPTPDETTNWKTYTNNFAKFSLKYPDSINYSEKSFSDKEKQVVFVGDAGKLTINLAAWGWSAGWGGGCEEKDKGIIMVGKTPKQGCAGETSFHQIYLDNPGIAYLNIYSEFKASYKETILRILSTFRFLE